MRCHWFTQTWARTSWRAGIDANVRVRMKQSPAWGHEHLVWRSK